MPKRMLSDGILTSRRIDGLSPEAEVLFYRLIVVADDRGRMDGRVQVLRAKCFPLRTDTLTNDTVAKLLAELMAVGLIEKYSAGGEEFVRLPKWEKHQRLRHVRAKYPDPPDDWSAADCGELPQIAASVSVSVEEKFQGSEHRSACAWKDKSGQCSLRGALFVRYNSTEAAYCQKHHREVLRLGGKLL